MRQIKWAVFISSMLIVFTVAALGSVFTSSEINGEWYQLIKPSITPPNYVFPIVWTVLFFMIGLSLYLLWINSDKKKKLRIAYTFGINFILNILWSFLYFGLKNPLLGLADIILIWLSILFMITEAWKIDRRASYLLMPYILWVTFAVLLNYLSI